MRLLRLIYKYIDITVGFISQTIAIVGIAGGVALAFYNVVARYIFGTSLTWAGELTMYLFLWSAFFGAAYCFKEDAHISVTILLDRVPPKVAKIFMLLSHSVSLIFLLAVSWYGYEYLELVIELDERSIDLDIPMWIPYLVIPISFAFAGFRVAEKIVEIIKTPANKILKESEAQMIINEVSEAGSEDIIKKVESKTGGLL